MFSMFADFWLGSIRDSPGGKKYSVRVLFLLFLLIVSVAAGRGGQPPSTPWVLYKWGNSGQYRPYSAPDATFSFPQTGNNVAYPAFLTTTTESTVLGDLTGKTISATLTLTTTGNPGFRFGGQGVWNFGSTPAHTRLFFSTSSAPYSNAGYTACPSCYWWSTSAWIALDTSTGTATISDVLDPAHWSNANGQLGSSLPIEFSAAVSNVQQIGVAYGGGSFYDNGVAITNGTGTAIFHLVDFSAE